MKHSLSGLGLQALLSASNDAYVIFDKNNNELLDWNLAFENLLPHQAQELLVKGPLSLPFLSHLQGVVSMQWPLAKDASDVHSYPFLPLGHTDEEALLSAKLVALLEGEGKALVQVQPYAQGQEMSHPMRQRAMEIRDTLLQATSQVAQELLSENEDFDGTINKVLGILGNATHVDRVYIWSIHGAPNPEEDSRLYTSQLYEWSEGAEPQQENELVHNMLVEEGIPTWIDTFLAGKCVNNLVKNMHQGEREVLEAQGIISILTAPIMFHGHLWGFIGFDNCHAEYRWSQAEEDILRTAGKLVSTAIHSRRVNEALHAAQERFLGVEEATGDIIWSVDAAQNFTYISPRLKAVLQYTPSEMLGKPFNALLLHSDEFTCTATPENYIMRDFELRARCKDGSIKWLRSSCKYIFDAQGKLMRGFGSSSDVTRVHEVQEALRVANKELEEAIKIANELADSANKANTIKSNFLANMSHEIRTPMNAIMGITHILKHTELSAEQNDYVAKIDASNTSLLKIVEDILDFSKVEDGNMAMEKQSFAMDALLQEVGETARKWINGKEITFAIHVDENVRSHYVGDMLRVKQVLTSLITNAIKFTHEGGVEVRVGVESQGQEETLLRFSITDTGIGLTATQVEHVFQGFVQADASYTRNYGGIGLGLALCKHLIALMGGEIWCESTLGKGTTFHFTCRLEREMQKALVVVKQLKEACILLALPSQESFEKVRGVLFLLGYAHVYGAKNMADIQAYMRCEMPPDIMVLHHAFQDAAAVEKLIRQDAKVFNEIPIIYSADGQDHVQIPEGFAAVESLGASALQDCFIKVLGPSLRLGSQQFQQGFEELLRAEHSGKKVLLVEDNAINQMIAQTILEDVGLKVTVANDGVEGCELMYKDTFDLVIMDIQMPRMDGLCAARKIREDARFTHVPIIAMTAHAMNEDREKSLHAGMNAHTTKPIDTAELFKTLFYWFSKKK